MNERVYRTKMSSNSQIGRNAQLLYNTVFAVKLRPLKHIYFY